MMRLCVLFSIVVGRATGASTQIENVSVLDEAIRNLSPTDAYVVGNFANRQLYAFEVVATGFAVHT